MAGQTARGYPYPDPGDPIRDGADAIKALAEAVGAKLGVMKTGEGTVPISSANTMGSVLIVFPLGSFIAPPAIALTLYGNSFPAGNVTLWISGNSVTSSSFTANAIRGSGSANINFYWVAVG